MTNTAFWPLDFACASGIFISPMRDHVILECTEAKAEGKPVSRYTSSRNKKLKQERMQVKKYNPNLRRHTLHKEIK